MIKDSKYCSHVIKISFYKELVSTEEDDENFESSIKCQICDNTFVKGDIKVRDHFHIIGDYRGATQIVISNSVYSTKFPFCFTIQKNCDAYLIMQELDKFDFKMFGIPSNLEI